MPRQGSAPTPFQGDDRFEMVTEDSAPPATFVETCRFLWSQRSAWHINAAGTIICLWGWGLLFWTQTYFERTFGLSTAQAGARLGMIYFWAGTAATIITGVVLAHPHMQDARRIARLLGAIVILSTIPSFLIYWTHSLTVATAMLWIVVPAVYL